MENGVLIIDALSAGTGRRTSSRDSIGCGPRAVAGVLERHSVKCRIARVEKALSNPGLLKGFRHLAISAMTMDMPVSIEIAKKWRRTNPKGKLLVGGPVASNPVSALNHLHPDILVLGEGESTLDELIRAGFLEGHIDFSSIEGVAFLDGEEPVATSPRLHLSPEEMSEVYKASTTRVVDYDAYQAARVYVETVRGCSNFRRTTLPLPNGDVCTECGNCDSEVLADRMSCPEDIPPGCGFCSVPGIWGPPRSRSIESVAKEVSQLIELGVHRIVLEAPDFLDFHRGQGLVTDPCYPPASTDAISELLEKLSSNPMVASGDVHISIENMKACLFTEKVAKVLSESMQGLSPNIGLETGSDEHLKSIGKCGGIGDVLRAIRIAKSFGMAPYVYLINGLPGETQETIDDSIRL
ncbi:MAG: B12-binding domain-containing radical SAM protein, partial [Candidatus Thorarchaeota archaeon]